MRKIIRDKDTIFNNEVIVKLLQDHQAEINRIKKLRRYYNNNNDIFKREYKDHNKPQNRLAHNYAGYITDNFVGYFVGQPITYKSDNNEFLKDVNKIFLYNDEVDTNATLAQDQSICGYACELLYRDIRGDIRFRCIDSENMIVVYDNTLEENIIFAIMISQINEETIDLYTFDTVYQASYSYDKKEKKLKQKQANTEHYFNDVPVVVYENNRQRYGDFEKQLSLIDAIDQANSDTANDFEYFTNALLVVAGVLMNDNEDLDFKQNRILNFTDTNSKAEYLIKNINDTALENYKNRLNRDIHKFSSVVDMSDENFAGNLSGIALKFKLYSMENVTSVKEAKFRKGLMRRMELITTYLATADNKSYNYLEISPVFTRNIPNNEKEISEVVKSLVGIVSNETLISQLPFVENVEKEMQQIAKEREEEFDFDTYNDMQKHEHSKEVIDNEE